MTNPQIRIINGDQVTDREMNDAEHAQYQKDVAAEQTATAAATAAAAAKKSAYKKLAALGLTAAEIAAL